MIIFTLLLFSAFYLLQINRMTYALVTSSEIPEEKHPEDFSYDQYIDYDSSCFLLCRISLRSLREKSGPKSS